MDCTRSLLLALSVMLAGCCSTDPELLTSSDPDERREVLACIAEDAPEHHAVAIQAAIGFLDLAKEDDPGVRGTAVRVLGFLDVRKAQQEISSSLLAGPKQDPEVSVRVAAIEALRQFGGDDALATLRVALREDVDAEVRLAAARELGALRDRSTDTATLLVRSLADPTLDVRQVARHSLVRLHQADFGLSTEGWARWLRLGGPEESSEEPTFGDELPAEEPVLPDEEPALPAEEEFPDEPMEPFEEEPALPPTEEFPDEPLGDLDEREPAAEEPAAEEPAAEEPAAEEELEPPVPEETPPEGE